MKGGRIYNNHGQLGLQGLAERKEILTHDTTWMNLKDIMLKKKIKPVINDKYCTIPLTYMDYLKQSTSQNRK